MLKPRSREADRERHGAAAAPIRHLPAAGDRRAPARAGSGRGGSCRARRRRRRGGRGGRRGRARRRGRRRTPTRCTRCPRRRHAGSAQALRALDRRRPAPDARRGARARPAQGRGRRGGEARADRGEPPPRDVDHAQLHEGRRPAPRPDPGGQPRPDPRGREVRLPDGLQAFDVRDLVDPPVGHPRARRPGPHDPACRCTSPSRCAGCCAHAACSPRSSTASRRSKS